MSTTFFASSEAKNLDRQPPRSPRERLGAYVILGRTLDKCRATLAGKAGEYHFDCPLDNLLFSFKGITGNEFKTRVRAGGTDREIVAWLDDTGSPRTPEDIEAWSNAMEAVRPFEDPAKREWFAGECRALGLDPARTTLFDYLEEDDRALFKRKLSEDPLT